MTMPLTVQVFNFRLLHRGVESAPVSSYKATRTVIVGELGGDPIESTVETVEPAALDEQGRYRRVATGWGALGD